MNIDTCTTTQWSAEPSSLHGTIPNHESGGTDRGLSIRHLDGREANPQGEPHPEGRILWVSLMNPRSLLGPLLDEMSFEGAWLEADGHARIRLLGQGEHRVAAPLFHSPESARLWLASELLKSASEPPALKPHDSQEAGAENLAA